MGANFEIEIAAKDIIQINELTPLFSVLGHGCALGDISSYGDIMHDSATRRAVDSPEEIAGAVEGGRIVHAGITLGGKRGGVIYSRESGYIMHSLWFDTELFPALDRSELDGANTDMCRALAAAVLELEFDFAALGPELLLAGDELEALIKGSSNVLIWLISDEMREGEIPGFELAGRSGSKLIFAVKPCQETYG